MPEKLCLEGTLVALLESFRAALEWNNRSETPKNSHYFDKYHRRASRRAYAVRTGGSYAHLLSPGIVLMITLQRLAALADTTAKLIVQLRELNELREQVRKAELAQRSLRLESRSQPAAPASGNRRSVSPTGAAPTTRNRHPSRATTWHLWTVIIPRRTIAGRLVRGQVWRRHDGRRWLYKKFIEGEAASGSGLA
jgi:hypothetical protein